VEVLAGYFFPTESPTDSKRQPVQCPYSDVTGSPFKLPTDSQRDLKWQIHTVTCLCFRQNHRDTTKRLMSSPKCRSVEVINNPARPGSNHREVNCINYR
jgi:hypothetical protein